MIRMADTASLHREIAEAVETNVLEVLRSGRYIRGPWVERAESMAASWFGRSEAVGVNSGTDALVLSLQAIGVRAGDEVIVPALTYFATAGAVCALGARPVVVDVRDDATLDPEAAHRAITGRTRAILPVHLFGTFATAPMTDVPVIDDSAQAIGAEIPRAIGCLTTLSTYPTKTWGGVGDGGFVIGDDSELIALVRGLGNHGHSDEPHIHVRLSGYVGRNSRLDAVQAAALIAHESTIASRVAARRRNAARYDDNLPPGIRALPRDAGSPLHHYVILTERRDALKQHLASRGIETAVYYPCSLARQPALAGHNDPGCAPNADRLSQRMLALPIHSALSAEQLDTVIAALWEA